MCKEINEPFDLLDLTSVELSALIDKIQLSLKKMSIYFCKYANHTSSPEILMNYVHKEFESLKILLPFKSLYNYNWKNNVYSDAIYSFKEDYVNMSEIDFKPLFSIIEIKFDLNTNTFNLHLKFLKDVAEYQWIFNSMTVSYNTTDFLWTYYCDKDVVHEFKQK